MNLVASIQCCTCPSAAVHGKSWRSGVAGNLLRWCAKGKTAFTQKLKALARYVTDFRPCDYTQIQHLKGHWLAYRHRESRTHDQRVFHPILRNGHRPMRCCLDELIHPAGVILPDHLQSGWNSHCGLRDDSPRRQSGKMRLFLPGKKSQLFRRLPETGQHVLHSCQ